MSAVVSKSPPVVVRPSVPVTTTGTINLSPLDKGLDAFPATFFFVFDHPIHEPAETIKRALAQALVHYYPIAGRLARRADGELCIRCTGEGVAFVAASAGCTLEEAKFFDRQPLGAPVKLLDELAAVYPPAGGRAGHGDHPLLMMQVTEFSCGGFVVGVTWNHAVADGAGMAQFVQAVGELARGGPSSAAAPTVLPVTSDDSLPSLPLLASVGRQMVARLEPREFACFDAVVPRRLIDRIRDEFRGRSGGRRCTEFEAVAAVVWRCRTRAVAAAATDHPALLSFVASVRRLVGAKDGYYGNCVTPQLVMATSAAVAGGDVADLVEMIKRGKEQIPEQLKHGGDGGVQTLKQVMAMASQGGLGLKQVVTLAIRGLGQRQLSVGELFRYSLLSVSCMRRLGLEEADFGGGAPARVMCRASQMALPDCVVCLPRRGEEEDGASVLLRCVTEEHAEAFRGALTKMFMAS
ncbi:hypothetical protein ACP4OV_026726 [Aristida adscensionis]